MKKMFELLRRPDERMKLILSVSSVGALLIAAILIPLAFRGTQEPADIPEEPAMAEQAQKLFADYWNLGPEATGITVTKLETVSRETKEACETVMRTLVARCLNDRDFSYSEPTGSEYTVISSGGREVPLCRMWLEARGDWQNWLDVCMNAESGEVYYLYLSRECLRNQHLYDTGAALPDAASIADTIAAEYGWTLRWIHSDKNDSTAAVFTTDRGTSCYQIDCRVFDALIDIKICSR